MIVHPSKFRLSTFTGVQIQRFGKNQSDDLIGTFDRFQCRDAATFEALRKFRSLIPAVDEQFFKKGNASVGT